MSRILSKLMLSAVLGLPALPALADTPVSTGFTYQGQLKLNGVATDGAADFQFRLYDANLGGLQIGSTITLSNVLLDDGLLTAQLNFGAKMFEACIDGSSSLSERLPVQARLKISIQDSHWQPHPMRSVH